MRQRFSGRLLIRFVRSVQCVEVGAQTHLFLEREGFGGARRMAVDLEEGLVLLDEVAVEVAAGVVMVVIRG